MRLRTRVCYAMVLTVLSCGIRAVDEEPAVVQDDFTGNALARHWSVRNGHWRVENGALVNREPGGRILCGELDWKDYRVTVRMRTPEPGPKPWSVGRVLFRYRNAGDYYYLLLHRTGLLELGAERNGRHRPGLARARTEASPGQWHVFTITAAGNSFRIALDGRPVLSFEDPTPITAGRTGIDAFQKSRVQMSRFTVRSSSIHTRQRRRREKRRRALETLGYRRSDEGNVAIFRDTGVPIENSCPSVPETLAGWLREAGYGVTFLTARQLADPVLLSPEVFDVLILPYGAAFPLKAIPCFRRYLERGGSFLTTGGYFGNNLYGAEDGGDTPPWVVNGDFADGLNGWKPSNTTPGFDQQTAPGARGRGTCARLEIRDGTPLDWYSLEQPLPALAPGVSFGVRARLRTERLRDGHGAYLAVNYFGKDGKRIRWKQSRILQETTAWETVEFRDTVPAGAAKAVLNLLIHGHGVAFFDDVRVFPATGTVDTLNTAAGDIHGPGNSLRVAPEQIGLFAPNYPLENVVQVRASHGQNVIPESLVMRRAVRGWSASGLFIGNGNPVHAVPNARPVYLLDALDAFGRVCGRAGVLVRNYRGMYAGSNWAAFGVTDADLFAAGSTFGKTLLLDTVHALQRKIFVTEAGPDLACYRSGEKPTFVADIANTARATVDGKVTFTVWDAAAPDKPVFRRSLPVRLDADTASRRIAVVWPADALPGDLYRVRTEFQSTAGTDSLDTAFVVWHEDRLIVGPRVTVEDAHLKWNGRSRLLCGASDAGYPYFSASETPLVWDRQFRLMRDFGLHCYRCMHFFSQLPKTTILALHDYEQAGDEVRRRIRRLDALVYLAQKHDLMFLFVDNCGLQLARDDPEELAARKRLLTLLARRYRQVPAFVFNQDHQEFIRKATPGNNAAFRHFLERKYKTVAHFAEAWGPAAPKDGFSGAAFLPKRLVGQGPYSAPARDIGEFLDVFREAWRRNHADAVHAGNPRSLLFQDFSLYWQPDFRWPKPDVMRRLDMVSAHFYGQEAELPVRARRIDMQVLGKPSGLTEFGILTHPAWRGNVNARLTLDDADAFFATAAHYAFGFGMSLMATWNWKEMRECIFPWSIAYHDLVPKPHFMAYRNLALFLGRITPRYAPPSVFVLCPSSRYIDGDSDAVERAVTTCIRQLLDRRVNFGMIGEQYLDRLPKQAKVLFVPTADRLPGNVRAALAEFAARGGTVCLWTRDTDAAVVLPGNAVKTRGPLPSGDALSVCANGSGRVLVCRAPLERHGSGGLAANLTPAPVHSPTANIAADLYARALEQGGVTPLPVASRPAGVRAFSVQTRSGGVCYVLHNPGSAARTARVTHAGHVLTLRLDPGDTGFAEFAADGELRAVEGRDTAELDGAELFRGKGRTLIMALGGGGLRTLGTPRFVLFIGEADVRLRTPQSPAGPWRAEFGEFQNGRWTPLETVNTDEAGGDLRLRAAGPLRSGMALLAPAVELGVERRRIVRTFFED
ncbi:MAG: DUF1080 domain-containing protein [Kiritimatiellaeota bacterium]|nr:DUF1080 domain-containing protein [Kiritimatiellota bacterium]